MKFSIAILLFCLGCSNSLYNFEEEQYKNYRLYESGEEKFGFATAKINGKEWRAGGQFYRSSENESLIAISLNTVESVFIREYYSFEPIVIDQAGKYSLKQNKASVTRDDIGRLEALFSGSISADDGHVIGQNYILDESFDNWLKITEWDEESEIIKGQFQLSMLRDEENLPSWDIYAKRITILDGYFECSENK